MRCPYCGYEIPEKRRFCGNCGYKLDQEPGKTTPDFLDEDAPTRLEDVHPVDEDARTRLEDVPPHRFHPAPGSRQSPAGAAAPRYSTEHQPVLAARSEQPSSKTRLSKPLFFIFASVIVLVGVVIVGGALLFLATARKTQENSSSVVSEMENIPTSEPLLSATGTETTSASILPTDSDTLPLVLSSCDLGTFLMDVTIPDGSELPPNTPFTKTWRIRNNGSCSWAPDYQLVFWDGSSLGVSEEGFQLGSTLAPGETIDVSIDFVTPAGEGFYRSEWVLKNSSGEFFGMATYEELVPLYVELVVSESYSTPTPEVP